MSVQIDLKTETATYIDCTPETLWPSKVISVNVVYEAPDSSITQIPIRQIVDGVIERLRQPCLLDDLREAIVVYGVDDKLLQLSADLTQRDIIIEYLRSSSQTTQNPSLTLTPGRMTPVSHEMFTTPICRISVLDLEHFQGSNCDPDMLWSHNEARGILFDVDFGVDARPIATCMQVMQKALLSPVMDATRTQKWLALHADHMYESRNRWLMNTPNAKIYMIIRHYGYRFVLLIGTQVLLE